MQKIVVASLFLLLGISCKKETVKQTKVTGHITVTDTQTTDRKQGKVTDISNWAASKEQVEVILNYKGSIDSFPITMRLEWNTKTNEVYGKYTYLHTSGESITVWGQYEKGWFVLEEAVYQNSKKTITGYFNLAAGDLHKVEGSWQNSQKSKERKVNIGLLENFDNEINLLQFKYTTESKPVEYSPNDYLYPFASRLSVLKNGMVFQTLPNLDEVISPEQIKDTPSFSVILEDINFDGFFDIKIPVYFPSRAKYDYSFLYFIYSDVTHQFVTQPDMDNLEYLAFDAFTQNAVRYEADGNGNEQTYYYKWQGQQLVLTRKEAVFEDRPETEITEYDTKNNQTVIKKVYTE